MSIHTDEILSATLTCPSAEDTARAAVMYGDGGAEGVIAAARVLLPKYVTSYEGEQSDGTWEWFDSRMSIDTIADIATLLLAWKKKGPKHPPSSWGLPQSANATTAQPAPTRSGSTAAARSASGSRKSGTTTPKATKSKARAK